MITPIQNSLHTAQNLIEVELTAPTAAPQPLRVIGEVSDWRVLYAPKTPSVSVSLQSGKLQVAIDPAGETGVTYSVYRDGAVLDYVGLVCIGVAQAGAVGEHAVYFEFERALRLGHGDDGVILHHAGERIWLVVDEPVFAARQGRVAQPELAQLARMRQGGGIQRRPVHA